MIRWCWHGWLVGRWSWLFGSVDRSFVSACVGSLVRSLVRACAHQLVGWLVGWVGWLVGWVGWCVRACMSFVHPFALSFGRSLSTSLSLSISLLLPISLTCGSVIAQLGARVSRYTAASWVLSNAGPKASLATARYPLRKRTSPCRAFARLRTRSPPACGASLPRGMLSS